MMTATMMMMKNIALAPFNDSWVLAARRRLDPWCLLQNYIGIQ